MRTPVHAEEALALSTFLQVVYIEDLFTEVDTRAGMWRKGVCRDNVGCYIKASNATQR
jgi:hypothetical protein